MICKSYTTRTKTTYLDPATVAYITGKWPENNGEIKFEIGVCLGTKECEKCKCVGNRKNCDFYENIRNECNESHNIFMVVVNSKIDYLVNDRIYNEGDILRVNELDGFPNNYAHYYTKRVDKDRIDMLDWIPKHMVSKIEI